jgi:hypothetical protein
MKVSLTHRPPLPPGLTWYSFLETESTPGHMKLSYATEKKPGDTGNRSLDLPTCSATPGPKQFMYLTQNVLSWSCFAMDYISPFLYLWLHLWRLLRDIKATNMERKGKSVSWICISYHGRYTGKRIATFAARVKAEWPLHKRKTSFENFSHASLLKSATKYYTVRVIPLMIFITHQFVYNSKLLVNSQRKYANILWASFALPLYRVVLIIFPPSRASASSEFSHKTYLGDLFCPQNEHRLFIINLIWAVPLCYISLIV